jgi:hypothetical protein
MFDVGRLVIPKGKKFGGLRSLPFKLEVDRIKGKWLVNYFMPAYALTHCCGDPRAS